MSSIYLSTVLAGLVCSFTASAAILATADYNGHTYYLLDAGSFDVKQAEATSLGGYLTTINDAAENQFLLTTFAGAGMFYIGLTDVAVPDSFEWINGEPVTYTNWNTGEPNNAGGGEAWTQFRTDGTWNDIPQVSMLAVAETPIPEPVTAILFGLSLAGAVLLRKRRRAHTSYGLHQS
jgi:hypothetical protein